MENIKIIEATQKFNEYLKNTPSGTLVCNNCGIVVEMSQYQLNRMNSVKVKIDNHDHRERNHEQCAKCQLNLCYICLGEFKIAYLRFLNRKLFVGYEKFNCPFCGVYIIENNSLIIFNLINFSVDNSIEILLKLNKYLENKKYKTLICNCCGIVVEMSDYQLDQMNSRKVKINNDNELKTNYERCAKCQLNLCQNCIENNKIKILYNDCTFNCPFCGEYKIESGKII